MERHKKSFPKFREYFQEKLFLHMAFATSPLAEGSTEKQSTKFWSGPDHGCLELVQTFHQLQCQVNLEIETHNRLLQSFVLAGETEDGEPLFVGRVQHEGTVTIGKVHPSHGVCYISYAGQELGFEAYEVLVA